MSSGFRTSILNEVEGPIVEQAQRRAVGAKRAVTAPLNAEIHSPTVRRIIMDVVEEYAAARQGIMEAKVGEEANRFVQEDVKARFDFLRQFAGEEPT